MRWFTKTTTWNWFRCIASRRWHIFSKSLDAMRICFATIIGCYTNQSLSCSISH